MYSPKSPKLKTIQSRNSSRSIQKSQASSKHSSSKKGLVRVSSGKIITKNSQNKYSLVVPMSPKISTKQYSSLQLKIPSIKSLKPSDTHLARKAGKRLQLEKPNVLKKKNQNYFKLQDNLKTIQNQIDSLRGNISNTDAQIRKVRNTRTKSKENRNNSINLSHKKRSSQPVIKLLQQTKARDKDPTRQSSKGLSAYITKTKPLSPSNQCNYSKFTEESVKSSNVVEDHKYYISDTQLTKKHIGESISTFVFMRKIRQPTDKQIESLKVNLPPISKSKKTLIFDMDQTLIHCVDTGEQTDIKLLITFPNGEKTNAGINIRPYAREILRNLYQKFEIIVFTASHGCYASVILDWLDPKGDLIHHRYFREHCYKTEEGIYIKDLRAFSNRNLDNMVLVDNSPYSYFFQLDNGLPILPFYNNPNDNQLKQLQKFILRQIYPAASTKQVLRSYFKLEEYKEFNNTDQLFCALYQ